MRREDLIKIFVVLMVLLFLFELFSYRSRYPFSYEENETERTAGSLGTALVNATLLSYPDGVVVCEGNGITNDAAFLDYLGKLRGNGTASYYTMGFDSVSIILAPGANVSILGREAAVRFSNYSCFSKATFLIPEEAVLSSDEGNVSIGGRRVSVKMEPVLEEGDDATIMLMGMVGKGQLVSSIEAKLVEVEVNASVPEKVIDLKDVFLAEGYYEWEHRNINASSLEEAVRSRYQNSSLDYQPIPFIRAEAVSTAQADEIKALDYVIAVYNDTILVDYDFRDRKRAEEDLGRILGNRTLLFPRSAFRLEINATEVDEDFLSSTFDADELSVRRLGVVSIGPYININGREYVLPGEITVLDKLPTNASIGDILYRPSKVVVKGGMVVRIV